MKKMMRVFVLVAMMITPVVLSVAGHGHKHVKHAKHKLFHKHYRGTKPLKLSNDGPSWN